MAPSRDAMPIRRRRVGVADRGGEFGGILNSGVVKGAGARAELVFKVGGGDGDAALNFSGALLRSLGKVEGAIEKQILPVGDRGGDGVRAEVGGQTASMESTASSAARLEEQNSAGLVAGGANGGFVLGEDGAGHDGGQNFAFGFVLRQHLIADAGVLHVKGNHLAQAEADHGDGFSGFGGKGIEVEDEDADERVGQDQR